MSSYDGTEHLYIFGGAIGSPLNVPIKDVAGWFERNGTLISCDDVLKQEGVEIENQTANDNHDKNGLAGGQQVTVGTIQGSPEDGVGYRNPILQTSTYDIAVSPHATLHIISLDHHYPRPAYMLVTETQCPHHNGTPRQFVKKKISYSMISNCGGYWVSDYCGWGGFQQALFFPIHKQEENDADNGRSSNSTDLSAVDFLLNGAILTDGVDMWLPSSNDRTNTVKIIQSTISSWMYEGSCPELILPTICNSAINHKRKEDSLHVSLAISRQVRQKTIGEEGITGKSMATTASATDWRTSIERALGERLKSLKQEQLEQARSKQIRDFVLLKNQKALQELIANNDDWTADDDFSKPVAPPVKLTELRYRLSPRELKPAGSSSGEVVLALEADIICLNEQTATGSDKTVALRNAYLSCSPVNIQHDYNNRTVVGQSGVIPLLHFGDHVTVSFHLKLDDKALLPQNSPSGKDLLDLTVCILGNHAEDEVPLCGLYLGSVCVPLSSSMQAPTDQKWCRCALPSERQTSRPCIAIDCQPPDPT